MKQMGIDVDEIDAEEVIIKTSEEDLIFDAPEVFAMEAQGEKIFQIVGEPEEKESIDQDDIELVAQRAGVEESKAQEALKKAEGDLAEAIESLS